MTFHSKHQRTTKCSSSNSKVWWMIIDISQELVDTRSLDGSVGRPYPYPVTAKIAAVTGSSRSLGARVLHFQMLQRGRNATQVAAKLGAAPLRDDVLA
jgi:hypothetical protein